MASLVYFGTATKQSWIKAPLSGMKAANKNWSSETQLLSGRSYLRRSKASHREFNASWVGSYNSVNEESLQNIINYADGLYGEGPFYWLDPFAVNQNLMPQHWAAPMLTEKDWPNLASGITPTFTAESVLNSYPLKYASYNLADNYESTNKLTLIIPAGYKLSFGWHGPAASSLTGIRIVPYLRSTGAASTAINPARINAGGQTRTNTNISGTTYSRVEIFIAIDTADVVDITAMIAQVLPEASSVSSGGFIAGKGTTGLEFSQIPMIDYMTSSINGGQIGMAANWVEV